MLLNGEDDRRYTQKVMVIEDFKIHNSIYRLFKLEQTGKLIFQELVSYFCIRNVSDACTSLDGCLCSILYQSVQSSKCY